MKDQDIIHRAMQGSVIYSPGPQKVAAALGIECHVCAAPVGQRCTDVHAIDPGNHSGVHRGRVEAAEHPVDCGAELNTIEVRQATGELGVPDPSGIEVRVPMWMARAFCALGTDGFGVADDQLRKAIQAKLDEIDGQAKRTAWVKAAAFEVAGWADDQRTRPRDFVELREKLEKLYDQARGEE